MKKEAEAFRRAFTLRVLAEREKAYREEVDEDERAELFADNEDPADDFREALLDEYELNTAAEAVLEDLFPGWDGTSPEETLVDQELLAARAAPVVKKLCTEAEARAGELGLLEDD